MTARRTSADAMLLAELAQRVTRLEAELAETHAELAAVRVKASEVPGLSAELDAVRWERDIAAGEPTAYAQALAAYERMVAQLTETLQRAGTAEREAARLRAIFERAGHGEHNVLALVEHYQQAETDARAEAAQARLIIEAAATALGAGWLASGQSLAEGIRAKTAMLESLVSVDESVVVPRGLVEAIVHDTREGLTLEPESVDELAAHIGGLAPVATTQTDTLPWCWRAGMGESYGMYPTRADALAAALDYEGPVEVTIGRCVMVEPVCSLDRIIEDAEEYIADDGHEDATVLARDGAEDALDAWCRRYLYMECEAWTVVGDEVVDLADAEGVAS